MCRLVIHSRLIRRIARTGRQLYPAIYLQCMACGREYSIDVANEFHAMRCPAQVIRLMLFDTGISSATCPNILSIAWKHHYSMRSCKRSTIGQWCRHRHPYIWPTAANDAIHFASDLHEFVFRASFPSDQNSIEVDSSLPAIQF